jgi:hypothetical protein
MGVQDYPVSRFVRDKRVWESIRRLQSARYVLQSTRTYDSSQQLNWALNVAYFDRRRLSFVLRKQKVTHTHIPIL